MLEQNSDKNQRFPHIPEFKSEIPTWQEWTTSRRGQPEPKPLKPIVTPLTLDEWAQRVLNRTPETSPTSKPEPIPAPAAHISKNEEVVLLPVVEKTLPENGFLKYQAYSDGRLIGYIGRIKGNKHISK